MIVVMKPGAPKSSIEEIISKVKATGLDVHLSEGKEVTIIGIVGDKSRVADMNLDLVDGVDKIMRVTESFKLSSRRCRLE